MEATRSSETSVHNKPTRRHISEDGILHSDRRENLKSPLFILFVVFCFFSVLPRLNSVIGLWAVKFAR
jgi:hypothetical protein